MEITLCENRISILLKNFASDLMKEFFLTNSRSISNQEKNGYHVSLIILEFSDFLKYFNFFDVFLFLKVFMSDFHQVYIQ